MLLYNLVLTSENLFSLLLKILVLLRTLGPLGVGGSNEFSLRRKSDYLI